MTVEHPTKEIELTPELIATLIKQKRKELKWSQEQLAAIAGIDRRTVQRVEAGKPSDIDSRRALSIAFEFADVDFFNKPLILPDMDAINQQQADLSETHLQFDAQVLSSGKELFILAENSQMDMTDKQHAMSPNAEMTFANLLDNYRDYRECAIEMSESSKPAVYRAFQQCIDELTEESISIAYAKADVPITWGNNVDAKPMNHSIVYFVVVEKGCEPEMIAIAKDYQYSL